MQIYFWVFYVHFVRWILTEIDFLFTSYDDVLEIPLQPLYDNLDSYTYEVFEKDPVKYIFYQRAIEQALQDKISEEDADTKTVFIIFGLWANELYGLNDSN